MRQAQSKPIISVILPTRNRRLLLRELIESLWAQTLDHDQYEVLIMDNCSEDGTAQMMSEMQGKSPCCLVYQTMRENKGPVHSRNVAARMARGQILAFIDSDCRATAAWLERGLAAFEQALDPAFVSGAVLDKPEQPVKFFCFRNGAIPGEENFSYPACNILVSKKVFWEMGGFDEGEYVSDIGDKPIECADTDLAWRILNKGYRHLYVDDMVVYHEVVPLAPWAWLKCQTRVISVPMVVSLHPQLREKICWRGPFFRAENVLFYLAALALLLCAGVNRWFLLLAVPYAWHGVSLPGPRFSITRIPRLAIRVLLLSVRQTVICASLIYGSLRCGVLVL